MVCIPVKDHEMQIIKYFSNFRTFKNTLIGFKKIEEIFEVL